MKFVHIAGDYETVDGVTFLFKNPTTVENKTTVEKLLKDSRFSLYQETTLETVLDACPKCGRTFQKGLTMHVRYCRGPE